MDLIMSKCIMDAPKYPPGALHNGDKVLWDSEDGHDSIFITEEDFTGKRGIGIRVAGRVTVMTANDWLNELDEVERLRAALGQARARICKLEGYICDNVIEGKLK